MKVLTISKKDGVAEVLIGKLTFDGDQPPQLTIVEEGPAGERLRSDWDETVAEGTLPLDVREVNEVDGDVVAEMKTLFVEPGSEDYYGAVWRYLETHYRYRVDIEEE